MGNNQANEGYRRSPVHSPRNNIGEQPPVEQKAVEQKAVQQYVQPQQQNVVQQEGKQYTVNDPFYLRILFINRDKSYYEHDKYKFLTAVWEQAIRNYNNAGDTDLKRAINHNMHKLIDEYNFELVRKSFVRPVELGALKRFRYVFKLARVCKGYELAQEVAVVVTLKINIDECRIAESSTGTIIRHDTMVNNKEYCCDKADVFAYKVVGDLIDVTIATPKLLDGSYTVVSNFDWKFTYPIGYTINEPNFAIKGTGCFQGIHFFVNEDAAVKYINRGMINKILMFPHVSKPLIPEEKLERTVSININNIETPVYISNDQEALVRYLNGQKHDSYQGLRSVCRSMFGDWYVRNNFVEQPPPPVWGEFAPDQPGLRQRCINVN